MSGLLQARRELAQARLNAELATKEHEGVKLALLAGKASVEDYAASLRRTHKMYVAITQLKVRLFFLEQLDYESKRSERAHN